MQIKEVDPRYLALPTSSSILYTFTILHAIIELIKPPFFEGIYLALTVGWGPVDFNARV